MQAERGMSLVDTAEQESMIESERIFMSKKKKQIKSHVKRLKLQQQKHPVSQEKYRKKLRIARRKDFFRNFWKTVGVIAILLAALFIAANLLMYKKTGETVMSCAREAKQIVEASMEDDFKLAQPTHIYSDDGTEIAELAEDEDGSYLTYDEIPSDIVNAFVAVEDRTFWSNSGVDYKGILRVCLNYVRTRGEVAEGASTITQQLARGTYLTNEKTMLRKIKEIFIARELTKKYSKEQIMEFYCNTCCFANGIYGVEDAAQTYFGKSVSELTLSEMAYICAIPNRPEYYNPLKQPENAVTRRDKILEDMVECGFIQQSACDEAKAQTITVASVEEDDTFYNYEVTYAINCAVRYLMKLDGFEFKYTFDTQDEYEEYNSQYDEAYAQARHELYTGGYEIYTTMNLTAQKELQSIVDEELAFSDTTTEGGTYELQGALTVIDNETGKVVAMIGGRSQENNSNVYSLNRGFQGYAQPGSSFKPLVVYAPALEEGYSSTSTLREIDVDSAKTKSIAEISEMSGTQFSLRSAVENSKNGCAYWLMSKITPQTGLSYVQDMQFTKIVPGDNNMSTALGGLTYGTTTVEMANAYSTLANHGEYTQTDCIEAIYDSNGNDIYEQPGTKTVYSRSAADEMTDILTGVLKRGTARRVGWYSNSDIAAAGKTGTTNDNVAGWFCGYTPYYTISVWVGCDQWKHVTGLEGGSYPLSIWNAAMLYMTEDCEAADFDLEGSYSQSSDTTEDQQTEDTTEDQQNTGDTQTNTGDQTTNTPSESTPNVDGDTGTTIPGDVPNTDTPSDSGSGTETPDTGGGSGNGSQGGSDNGSGGGSQGGSGEEDSNSSGSGGNGGSSQTSGGGTANQ